MTGTDPSGGSLEWPDYLELVRSALGPDPALSLMGYIRDRSRPLAGRMEAIRLLGFGIEEFWIPQSQYMTGQHRDGTSNIQDSLPWTPPAADVDARIALFLAREVILDDTQPKDLRLSALISSRYGLYRTEAALALAPALNPTQDPDILRSALEAFTIPLSSLEIQGYRVPDNQWDTTTAAAVSQAIIELIAHADRFEPDIATLCSSHATHPLLSPNTIPAIRQLAEQAENLFVANTAWSTLMRHHVTDQGRSPDELAGSASEFRELWSRTESLETRLIAYSAVASTAGRDPRITGFLADIAGSDRATEVERDDAVYALLQIALGDAPEPAASRAARDWLESILGDGRYPAELRNTIQQALHP